MTDSAITSVLVSEISVCLRFFQSTSKSLAAIVEFHQALTVLNASAYAQRTPVKYTKALQASSAEFDKACLALKLHLVRLVRLYLGTTMTDTA